MQMPTNWKNERSSVENGQTVGHDEFSGTIAVHSLAVLPEHQGKQVGSTLMRSYIQRIKEAAIAERIVLIAHDNLIPFYQGFGFENRGPSECQYGGGGWYDMVSLFIFIFFFFLHSSLTFSLSRARAILTDLDTGIRRVIHCL